MNLIDVKYCDEVYFDRKAKLRCKVVANHVWDGACLIVEYLDDDGDISGEIGYTEACFLEKAVSSDANPD
jgi:hypothetical protein